MSERASLLGGKLSIESQPGTGTTVKVRIPYQLEDTYPSEEGLDNDSTITS
jgi:signal transduction histidine kinase